ncbi:Phosphoglycerate kinase [Salinivirga cyanobacteriivorans]|uniref:Phosphoglycerate kinase n=1 Tax=Salinivirga cyanobacteriivorans TaxID=1307839 RepID=A0A0S2HZV0_9BACT|nr:phosphoglycerate kinase [Salinivirga cyanobacteriivorans]ALO15549.1 Phosphoglycerate kinase [Salinivirga cyanobacteriivorans]
MQDITAYKFKNKKALIRVDFNVPLNDQFEVTDDTRIKATMPTIKEVLKGGGSAILMSHLGRPKGAEEKYSLKHVVPALEKITGKDVIFVPDCIGDETVKAKKDLAPGEILLLENLRFYPEEKKGDAEFAKKLAEGADVYVNDAFATAHRAHASTSIIAALFGPNKMFGKVMTNEIQHLDKALNAPKKGYTAIIGGAKVSSKIIVIEQLLKKVDKLVIGGAMAYTFIKAQGGKVGDSMVEEEYIDTAKKVMEAAAKNDTEIILPVDSVNGDAFKADANTQVTPADDIEAGWMGMDIGPETLTRLADIISKSKTILWNGPVGVFEMEKFARGTFGIAQMIADATGKGLYSLVGGGDSVSALNKSGLANEVSYVSTGGGAMLEYIEGKKLPGIAAIG